MKKVLAGFLFLAITFCFVGCGNTNTPAKTVGESFATDDFSYTVKDFQFVNSVSMGDYYYDLEDVVSAGEADSYIIAFFNFEIENTGSEAINLIFSKPVLVAGDIEYDGSQNGDSEFYCITSDDNDYEISPLEKKEYNYCIFNIPASLMNQSTIQLKIEIYGKECIYTIK